MKPLTKKDKQLLVMCFVFLIGSIVAMYYVKSIMADDPAFHPKPLTDEDIKKYSNDDLKAVIIYPILTQYAYQKNGFYDFYSGKCSTCTTVSLKPYGINASYNIGKNSFDYLTKLSYPFITDLTVDRHPNILKDYDEIILLHNEYMTQNEFNAIKNHTNVVYLYPNSMYAKVSVDYNNWSMTLLRGHGYPEKNITNGFNYVTTSQYEYDVNCKNYFWKSRPNGIGLSCWPEYLITYDRNILQTLLDYPDKVPSLKTTTSNFSDIRYCERDGSCNKTLDSVLSK